MKGRLNGYLHIWVCFWMTSCINYVFSEDEGRQCNIKNNIDITSYSLEHFLIRSWRTHTHTQETIQWQMLVRLWELWTLLEGMQFGIKQLKIERPRELDIPPLHLDQKQQCTRIWKQICIPLSIAALLTIAIYTKFKWIHKVLH